MATIANQPSGIDNKSLEEKYEYRNTDFGGRWHGADGLLGKIESNPLFQKAKDSIQSEVDKLKGGSKSDAGSTDKKPDAALPPKGETKILGMHPMTLVLGTAGVLILATVGIIVVKMIKK